jgi:hypothetical protein
LSEYFVAYPLESLFAIGDFEEIGLNLNIVKFELSVSKELQKNSFFVLDQSFSAGPINPL